MKLEKEISSAATIDPKDKLAALREKRRLREAGTASNISEKSTSAASISSASSPNSPAAATPTTPAAALASASAATVTAFAPTIAVAAAIPTDETPQKLGSLKPVVIENSENCAEISAEMESKIDAGASPCSVPLSSKDKIDYVSTDGIKREGDSDRLLLSTATSDDSGDRIRELGRKVSELSATLESAEREKASRQKEIVTLNDLTKSLLQQLNKSQEEKDKAHEKIQEANKIILSKTNTGTDMKIREGELEAQVNELMDTLEILTLDKEQLVMENELLQAQIDESRLQGTKMKKIDTCHNVAGRSTKR